MEHEIIIKNGIAGVEINGRFYTHTCYMGEVFYMRQIDVDSAVPSMKTYAYPSDNGLGEHTGSFDPDIMMPIPNPALEWPAGTKVMVRNCDNTKWLEAVLNEVFDDRVSATIIGLGFNLSRYWKQCKLAEGGE